MNRSIAIVSVDYFPIAMFFWSFTSMLCFTSLSVFWRINVFIIQAIRLHNTRTSDVSCCLHRGCPYSEDDESSQRMMSGITPCIARILSCEVD